jgi:hypothetical protein
MAQTAQIVSLSDYRQARDAARADRERASDMPFAAASPFTMVWVPVWFVPVMPYAQSVAQSDERT